MSEKLTNSLNQLKKILLKLTSIKSHREKLIQFFIFRNYCSHHFSGTIAMKNYVSGKLHF